MPHPATGSGVCSWGAMQKYTAGELRSEQRLLPQSWLKARLEKAWQGQFPPRELHLGICS